MAKNLTAADCLLTLPALVLKALTLLFWSLRAHSKLKQYHQQHGIKGKRWSASCPFCMDTATRPNRKRFPIRQNSSSERGKGSVEKGFSYKALMETRFLNKISFLPLQTQVKQNIETNRKISLSRMEIIICFFRFNFKNYLWIPLTTLEETN